MQLTDEPEMSVLSGLPSVREQERPPEMSPEMARALALALAEEESDDDDDDDDHDIIEAAMEAEAARNAPSGSTEDKHHFQAMQRESSQQVLATREEPKVEVRTVQNVGPCGSHTCVLM